MMKNKMTAMLRTGRIEFTVLDYLILNLAPVCFDPLGSLSIFGFRICFVRLEHKMLELNSDFEV